MSEELFRRTVSEDFTRNAGLGFDAEQLIQ
jgi:hypothetical protein